MVSLSVGIYYGAVQQSVHDLLDHDRWDWSDMAVLSGFWAVIWLPAQFLGQAVARRGVDRGWLPKSPARRRQDAQEHLIGPALKAGVLPPDVDPEAWRPALRAAARELNVVRWLTLVGLVGVAGLVGSAAMVENGNSSGVWGIAVLIGAEALLAFRLFGRQLRVVEGFEAQLRQLRPRTGQPPLGRTDDDRPRRR